MGSRRKRWQHHFKRGSTEATEPSRQKSARGLIGLDQKHLLETQQAQVRETKQRAAEAERAAKSAAAALETAKPALAQATKLSEQLRKARAAALKARHEAAASAEAASFSPSSTPNCSSADDGIASATSRGGLAKGEGREWSSQSEASAAAVLDESLVRRRSR